ncbi:MAG TPA: M23 family metallopeptidase [Saprospiraceae bacterium]|nr:M23 family metallopeptidase [Saprospiraceae bacterium]
MSSKWSSLKNKLRTHLEKSFLLILRDEETFEETASYKLTLLNIYILGSSILLVVGILLWLLIVFTPLRKYIPGYGDVSYQPEYTKLQKKLTEVEEQLKAQDVYIEGIQRVLTGNPQTSKDITKDVKLVQESAQPVNRIKEDSLLRTEFESQPLKKVNTVSGTYSGAKATIRQIDLADIKFFPPLRGPQGARYSPDKDHLGVDIIAPANSPIKAVLAGTVLQSDWTLENGHMISIQHDFNLVSIYKHNSALLKKTGAQVKAGEVIAIIGNTGTLTNGPHLHFELWQNGRPINPALVFKFD